MNAPPRIAQAALKRLKAAAPEIRNSVAAIADGRPGDAEKDTSRRQQVYQARTGVSLEEATRLVARAGEGAERKFGNTVDFVDVVFFERGRRAAHSVARIITRDGAALGTGFLISPRLLITNNHVIGSKGEADGLLAEFDYERDINGAAIRVTRFAFDHASCFLTNDQDDLDYTVIALGDRTMGEKDLGGFGYIPVSNARNKHQLGDFVNIIQHPDGRMKEAVLRENQLVARAGTTLHYLADTEPGSSGSPVLNVQFALVALHHWGTPHRELNDENGKPISKSVNEGIRASSIYTDLTTLKVGLEAGPRALIDQALQLGLDSPMPVSAVAEAPTLTGTSAAAPGVSARIDSDGTAVWHIPLTVAVRLGGHGAALAPPPATAVTTTPSATPARGGEKKLEIDPDFSDRDGYNSAFLGSAAVPLPKPSAVQKRIAAKNKKARAGDNPLELKYHHYSVIMNGKRRLAFVSAVNIDGAKSKDFNRDTGVMTDPFADEGGGGEATELWFSEDRIDEDQQTPRDFYQGQTTFDAQGNQIVDKKSTQQHLMRMFQQGHLTRRQDPLWGDDEDLIRFANADTFHVTNCTPQVGFFNMGMAKKAESLGLAEATKKKAKKKAGHPGGQLYWRALEDYVLTNARADRQKVSVFTGPIFDDDKDFDWDRGRPDMKGFKAPREFWKLILRIDDGALQATALIADQAPLIDYLPEFIMRGEAAVQPLPYNKVAHYHYSVEELEKRTGFDFGDAVRKADTFVPEGRGEGRRLRRVESLDEITLTKPKARTKRRK
jgi:endonuclease G, mitochondrial